MTNETRSPEEIERDIERERAGLSETLDDLQDRFSVETIARQLADQFREHGGDIGRSVSEAVKANPVALALTGVGLAWLMMGGRSDNGYRPGTQDRDHAADARHDGLREARARAYATQPPYIGRYGSPERAPHWARTGHEDDSAGTSTGTGTGPRPGQAASAVANRASDAASDASEDAGQARAGVSDKAQGMAAAARDAGASAVDAAQDLSSSAADRAAALRDRLAQGTEDLSEEARWRVLDARQRAVEAREAAADYARQGRDRVVDIFEEQPLVAGALAVAFGAALGAALPRSRIEDEYLGEQSDHLIEEAERILAEEKEKLGKVAKAARDAASRAAQDIRQEAEAAASSVAESADRKAD